MKALSIIGIILSPILCIVILVCLSNIGAYRVFYGLPVNIETLLEVAIPLVLSLSIFLLAISIVGVVTGTRYNRLKRNNNSNQE